MPDQDLKSLQDAIYRKKVECARRMTALEKFEAGQSLFELGCLQILGNIRSSMPDADQATQRQELRRRLGIGRRLDDLQLRSSFRG